MVVYAGGGSSIDVFRADLATGLLTFQASVPAGDDAALATADLRGRLYVQTKLGTPVVMRAFDSGDDGTLNFVADHPLPPVFEGMTELLTDPPGRWLLMSSMGSGSRLVDQLSAIDGGRFGEPRTISSDFYGFAWDPSGRFLFGLDGLAIRQYRFDGATGASTPNDPPQAAGSMGHRVLGLVHHPSGQWSYAVEESAIGVYALDASHGTLTALARALNALGAEAVTWSSIALHPSGRHLYAVGSVTGTLQAIIDQFSVDTTTGALTFARRERGAGGHELRLGGLQAPLVVGDFLVLGGGGAMGPALAIYRMDADQGTLSAVGDLVPVPAATSVRFLLGFITSPSE